MNEIILKDQERLSNTECDGLDTHLNGTHGSPLINCGMPLRYCVIGERDAWNLRPRKSPLPYKEVSLIQLILTISTSDQSIGINKWQQVLQNFNSFSQLSLLVTTMPDITYPLIKGHLCTPSFCCNLKPVPRKPSIFTHKTMGRYKFLLSSLGESDPTAAALHGRALYRAGGYIAWNPLAFQQVEKVVHIVGSNGGMYSVLPILELTNSVRIPFSYFP
jgi:hypothetical protein